MANQWFVSRGGKKVGPFSSVQLKQLASSGKIRPKDQVLKDGASEWVPAQSVEGLFPEAVAAPPQPPSPGPSPQQEKSSAGQPAPAGRGKMVFLACGCLVLFLGIGGAIGGGLLAFKHFAPSAATDLAQTTSTGSEKKTVEKSSLPALLQKLESDQSPEALSALEKHGPLTADDLPVLEKAAKSGNGTVRAHVIRTLANSNLPGDKLALLFLEAAKDQLPEVRAHAFEGLAKHGSSAQATVLPALFVMLKDKDPQTQKSADQVLRKITPQPGSLPLLTVFFRDEAPVVRTAAIQAAGRMGKEADLTVPDLIEVLSRARAADEMALLYKAVHPLAGALFEAATERSPGMTETVLEALEKIRPDLHRRVVILLKDANLENHVRPIQELGYLGADAAAVVPILQYQLRKHIAEGELAKPLKAKLLTAEVEALGRIGPDDPATLKSLLVLAGPANQDLDVRKRAWQLLGMAAEHRPAIRAQTLPVLAKVMDEPALRLVGIEAAGKHGALAKELGPALKNSQADADVGIRTAAIEALARIESGSPPAASPKAGTSSPEAKAALVWLAMKQEPDGSWSETFKEPGGRAVRENVSIGSVNAAFCALALMASGEMQFQESIDRAAVFVGDNLFHEFKQHSNWRVAIGGLFLCEYYAAQKQRFPNFKSPKYDQLLQKIADECLTRMEPSGGWAHEPRVPSPLGYLELEVMNNWMLTTVGACQRLGSSVPPEKLVKPLAYIEDCCKPGEGGIGYSPRPGQKGTTAETGRTGGAIFAFVMLNQQQHSLYPRMVDYWKKHVDKSADGHGSLTMGLLSSALAARQIGDEEWRTFQEKLFKPILANAKPDGTFVSLTSQFKFATPDVDEGKVKKAAYITAVSALILQLDRGNLAFLGQRHPPAKPAP